MTREESLRHFEREVGLVFQQEWKRASRIGVIRAFLSGALTATAISLLVRLI